MEDDKNLIEMGNEKIIEWKEALKDDKISQKEKRKLLNKISA